MIEEIKAACRETGQPVPDTVGELMRCVYESLTGCYADSINELSALTGRTYTSINIVGGGCQDTYLNELTARACGIPVFAGPIEGTSLGNLMVQMIGDGVFADLDEAREPSADRSTWWNISPNNPNAQGRRRARRLCAPESVHRRNAA